MTFFFFTRMEMMVACGDCGVQVVVAFDKPGTLGSLGGLELVKMVFVWVF